MGLPPILSRNNEFETAQIRWPQVLEIRVLFFSNLGSRVVDNSPGPGRYSEPHLPPNPSIPRKSKTCFRKYGFPGGSKIQNYVCRYVGFFKTWQFKVDHAPGKPRRYKMPRSPPDRRYQQLSRSFSALLACISICISG